MEPRPTSRKKKNSTRVNLIIALVFHLALAFVGFFWAAHEGALGKKLQEITIAIVPKEKPSPEPEKPPPPPPIVPPKEELKVVEETPPPPVATPPVQSTAPAAAAVAPAAAVLPDFNFNDGAKPVETGTNGAVTLYKSQVEYTLRSNWERPDGIIDDNFVAEVELSVNPLGLIKGYTFKKTSGNQRWDDSVKRAIATTKSLNIPQPKGFPEKFMVRFDVLPVTTELLTH